jgi:hypothetical protein
LFGIVYLAALVANAVLAFRLRRRTQAFDLALIATLCLVVVFAIFFMWTFPANQATATWTTTPDNRSELRQQWECSHTVNAVGCWWSSVQ